MRQSVATAFSLTFSDDGPQNVFSLLCHHFCARYNLTLSVAGDGKTGLDRFFAEVKARRS